LPEEKVVLQDAAVVGKVFWLGALETLGHGPRRQAEEMLFGLARKEFVQPVRRSKVAGDAEYAFRHVLLRDVAYGQIPRAARGDKHRLTAAWIESLGRPEDHAEMLAHHYLSALEYAHAAGRDDAALAEPARLAMRAAGDRAFALASYAAAARFYEAALELWPEDDPDRVWLLVHAGRASHAADGRGINLLERGFDGLRSRGDANGAAEVAVDLARCHWFAGDRDTAYSYVDQALELTGGRAGSTARAHALVARAAYHMLASEHPQAISLARQALTLTEAVEMQELHVRALDVLGTSRALSGDVGGLDDSRCAIAHARESKALYNLMYAEGNLYMNQVSLGQLDAASKTLDTFRRDMENYGTAMFRPWLRGYEAFEWVVHGRWDDAIRALDSLIAEVEAGGPHYLEPSWRALRASIAFARGDFEGASTGSEEALARARTTKDPQLLAPALACRGMVLLAQGRREQASRLASEALALGSVPLGALLEVIPVATPIEFAWLLRDLGRETELLFALESAPSTPWLDAARAIAHGEFAHCVELVARIGAPSVEAYARLRTAEELAGGGRHASARDCLAPALAFFTRVGATRYLRQADGLLARSG
jgi:tetratricopeptide (TPR) repeat protein